MSLPKKSQTMTQYSHTLLIALVLMLPLKSLAQQDPKAEPYLKAVSDQFDMNTGYLIQMDYIREDIMRETSAEGEGTIWMKGLKYKMEVNEFIVYFDGEKLYSQNTDAEEVYVSEPDPDQPGYLQTVPIRIIKAYEQDFKYMLMGITNFHGKDRLEIQLYPKDVSGPYSLLKIFVNQHDQKLEAFQLKHKEGIQYTMFLTDIKGKQAYDESLFRFNPSDYPETEIIELIE
jgi:outer membrane lipoprotein-sorting protein